MGCVLKCSVLGWFWSKSLCSVGVWGVEYVRRYVPVVGVSVLFGEPVLGGGSIGSSVGWMWVFGVR